MRNASVVVHRSILVFTIMCLAAVGMDSRLDLKSCLEPVLEEKDVKTNHYLLVSLQHGRTAIKGDDIMDGDQVIGFDGFRVSTVREYELVQWQKTMHNAPLKLRVIRNGKFKDLVIHSSLPARRLGMVLSSNSSLSHILLEHGVDMARLFKQKLGGGFDRHRRLEFPSILAGPCLREISRLLSRGNADRKWALKFVDVYLNMIAEDYDKAKPGINALLQDPKGSNPLMVRVLKFYAKVAQKQPDADTFPLKFYDVTKEFAAVYYPYPYYRMPKIGNVFPDDPAYQKVLETVLYGSEAEAAKARQDTSWKPKWSEGDSPEQRCEYYMYCVKRSFVDPARHGGWPYRSAAVQRSEKRKTLLRKLRARYDRKPNDRFITSIGLVMAGLYGGSAPDVKKGQGYIATLGPTENAMLMEVVSRATRSRVTSSKSDRYLKGLRKFLDDQNRALERRLKIPGVYQYLYNHSPVFHGVGLSDYLESEQIAGFGNHYSQQPWLVAPAIAEELSCPEMWRVIQAGKVSDDPEDVRQAFRYATMRLCAGRAWKTEVEDFLALAKRMPISDHYRACIQIICTLGERRRTSGETYVDFAKVISAIKAREERDFPKHFQIIESWDNKSPRLASTAADYFEEHGSPLVSLALYRKLHDAGQRGKARRFKGYATNFAIGALQQFGDKYDFYLDNFWYNLRLNYLLAAGLAGSSEMADAVLTFFSKERLGGEPFASTATMFAYALGNLGEWDKAVYQLERAFGMPTTRARIIPPKDHRKRKHVVWFHGKALSSETHDFPLAVAKLWLKSPKVSDAHKSRIRTAVNRWRTLDKMGPVRAEGRGLIAVPSKGEIVIDGKLDDWDLSAARTVAHDIRYARVCSAEVALSYDEKGLYGGIHFNDASPMDHQFTPTTRYFAAADSAIFCFRIGNRSSSVASWYSSIGNWNDPVVYQQIGNDAKSPEKGSYKRRYYRQSHFKEFKVAFARDANEEGYTQEIFIPWDKISNDKGIPRDEIKFALELNWGYGLTAWYVVANLKPGVQVHNRVRMNTDNYGVLKLSARGNLKLPQESWRQATAGWKAKQNAKKCILHTVNPPANARFSKLASAGPNLTAIDAQHALTIWPTADPAISRKGKTVKLNKGGITAVAGNRNGSIVALGGHDGKLFLLSTIGKVTSESKPCGKAIRLIKFSPKGTALAVAGADRKVVTYKLPVIDKPTRTIKLSKPISALEFITDSKLCIGLYNGNVAVIDLASGKSRMLERKHKFAIRGLTASADGKRLFSIAEDLSIGTWDAVKGVSSKVFTAHESLPRGLLTYGDGKLVSVGLDGNMVVSDAKEGKVVASTVIADDGIVSLTRFGKDQFAVLDRNGKIFIVDPSHILKGGGNLPDVTDEKIVDYRPKIKPEPPRNTTTRNDGPATEDPEEVMKLADVYKALALDIKGFTLSETSVDAADLKNDSRPILCDRQYTFNGNCEYSVKVRGRWYHAVMLMIGGKEYIISVGHWANNGTRIVIGGKAVNYKGKEYKAPRNRNEWHEVKIIIANGSASFFYDGAKVHEGAVAIPKNSKLQWGVCPYRGAISFKDFSLKLNEVE